MVILFFEMLAIITSRNIVNYNFPKCWQLEFPEMLAIVFVRNAGDKCWQLSVSKNVDECYFQKCQQFDFQEMLTIVTCRNSGINISRNVDNYSFQKSWQL